MLINQAPVCVIYTLHVRVAVLTLRNIGVVDVWAG